MGTGWRRALCTSVRRDAAGTDGQSPAAEVTSRRSPSPSPRSCSKLSFFSGGGSNPSTPRALRCRTKPPQCEAAEASSRTPPPPAAAPPCTAARKGLLQAASAPCSPRSPSKFALFKSSLLSRGRCGLCSHSVKGSTPVFTAECSHAFHFPCIAAHVRANPLSCPVCSATWRRPPFLASLHLKEETPTKKDRDGSVLFFDENAENRNPYSQKIHNNNNNNHNHNNSNNKAPNYKVYDDDEPLVLSKSTHSGFNPIPEADEEEDIETEDNDRFRHTSAAGFGLALAVSPEAALLASGRRHGMYVVAVRVKAPQVVRSAAARRAPVDLVTVLDVGPAMTGEKLRMLKRAVRLVVASLGPADRLSIVAFSGFAAKRLLPLTRMSKQGQRSARHIVDRLVVSAAASAAGGGGGGACVGDALKKATKVLEDRRERNPVATVMLLSDTQQEMKKETDSSYNTSLTHHRAPAAAPPGRATTRFSHVEIPIGGDAPPPAVAPPKAEDAFVRCLGGLVNIVMQDVRLQLTFPSGEISAVYSSGTGHRAAALCTDGGTDRRGGVVSVRLGDLYAEEERELLVELKAPLRSKHHHAYSMSVRCSYRDPATGESVHGGDEPILLPPLNSHSSASARIRDQFVATRALAESRRLADLSDHSTALHLLSSARSLLLQSQSPWSELHDLIGSLEGELKEVELRREPMPVRRVNDGRAGGEALTPTSAWRAAEQLAKVAIMRKSMNRVGDLHGFENARF